MKRFFASFVLLVALLLAGHIPTYAASVTSTFTATGNSTALFVPAGEKVRVQLLNVFVATVKLQVSFDAGGSYQDVNSQTTTFADVIDAQLRNALYRFLCTAYTSGTVSYDITNVPAPVLDRAKFKSIPIGAVAYGSLGSVLVPPVAGTLYTTDVVVGRDMIATGAAVLNGATCSTDKYVLWLFDYAGTAVAHTAVAGTTCSGTDAFQEIAFTQAVKIPKGLYWIGMKMNGTTDRTRFVTTATYGVDMKCSAVAHTSQIVGSFGSTINGIAVPTAFTAGQCPIAYVYE